MGKEIEHKYLIKPDVWKDVVPDKKVIIRQGYLSTDPEKTVRVRTKGEQGYITVKGKASGATRAEYEYEIPIDDANELIDKFCGSVIEKTRHIFEHTGKKWEVDEFFGMNEGLIVAEIELKSEDEKYVTPPWVSENVTEDVRYANSNLTIKPYKSW